MVDLTTSSEIHRSVSVPQNVLHLSRKNKQTWQIKEEKSSKFEKKMQKNWKFWSVKKKDKQLFSTVENTVAHKAENL